MLELRDRPTVEPGPGEVLVHVVISGVDPTDWKHRAGPGPGHALEFAEIVPNQDGAGVVKSVGPEVAGVAVGDRVWVYLAQAGRPTGTAQQYVVLPASRVVALPDGATFEVGASLGGAGALAVGEIAGLPLHRFALVDTAAAHDAVQGGVTGKVLIDVG